MSQNIEDYLSKGGLITIVESQEKRNAWTKKKRKPKLIKTIYIDEPILKRFTCQLCTCRVNCKAICPPIAWMIKQVEYEPPKEAQLINEPTNNITSLEYSPKIASIDWPDNQSTGESIIKKYFIERKQVKQIAKELNISIQYTYREIRKYKDIIAKNMSKTV